MELLSPFSSRQRDERAFTLIELLIVVSILAILVVILIPNFFRVRTQSSISASKANIKDIATALEVYYVDNQVYPADTTLNVLVTGGYVRLIARDPCTNNTYTYTPSGTPPNTYMLQTPTWTSSLCAAFASGVSYTPTGGLAQF